MSSVMLTSIALHRPLSPFSSPLVCRLASTLLVSSSPLIRNRLISTESIGAKRTVSLNKPRTHPKSSTFNSKRGTKDWTRSEARTDLKKMVDRITADSCSLEVGKPLHPKRVLVLSKFTRLDYEKAKDETLLGLDDKKLIHELVVRGFDKESLSSLISRNETTRRSTDHLVESLYSAGITVKCVSRFEYTKEAIDWADMIITSGGDGTFLMAASKITGNKPLLGFNSDPSRSVGHLLLPGQYTSNFPAVLEALRSGTYHWMRRQRIRTTLSGRDAWCEPLELHQQQMNHSNKYSEMVPFHDGRPSATGSTKSNRLIELENPLPSNGMHPESSKKHAESRILPILALNEVFIGESLSGRVSYTDIAIGPKGAERVQTKSSGLAICTGTGSTSWSYNINKLNSQTVSELIDFSIQEAGLVNSDAAKTLTAKDGLHARIADRFNSKLVFDPTQPIMQYTLRDPVMFPTYPSRGRAARIEVASHMQDACVVIDGGPSYSFNIGTSAVFEIHAEDSLTTIKLPA